ncbi:hypothetical protein SKAU_G00336240 [Synaphobranchus kaupii]|uniref:Uncharacterized protein n=1 Tax=Synaphobranchus kaupii TaxID=118154 RepID=A0A9Q1EM58_SYNKA|nr:hypothetical protein SKAU_G00336240 [Synaphobranchus kaupii]
MSMLRAERQQVVRHWNSGLRNGWCCGQGWSKVHWDLLSGHTAHTKRSTDHTLEGNDITSSSFGGVSNNLPPPIESPFSLYPSVLPGPPAGPTAQVAMYFHTALLFPSRLVFFLHLQVLKTSVTPTRVEDGWLLSLLAQLSLHENAPGQKERKKAVKHTEALGQRFLSPPRRDMHKPCELR